MEVTVKQPRVWVRTFTGPGKEKTVELEFSSAEDFAEFVKIVTIADDVEAELIDYPE